MTCVAGLIRLIIVFWVCGLLFDVFTWALESCLWLVVSWQLWGHVLAAPPEKTQKHGKCEAQTRKTFNPLCLIIISLTLSRASAA